MRSKSDSRSLRLDGFSRLTIVRAALSLKVVNLVAVNPIAAG